MNVAILGNPDSWYVAELRRAAEARRVRASLWDFTRLAAHIAGDRHSVLHSDEPETRLDAVIVRTMPPGSLEQVVFRMNLLGRLEAAGTKVLNSPRAIECAVDKTSRRRCFSRRGFRSRRRSSANRPMQLWRSFRSSAATSLSNHYSDRKAAGLFG